MSCTPHHVTADESKRQSNKQRFEREIDRHHKWTAGHDPNDPDAEEGSCWEYVKISGENITEDQTRTNPYARKHGPPSGIVCIYCHDAEMVVIDERPAEEIAKNILGYDYRLMRGRERPISSALLIICPKCEKVAQVSEEIVRRKKSERAE